MYDRAKFFAGLRALAPRFTQTQVDGLNAVLDAAPVDLPGRHLAYCLATAWHETAFTMRPIEEYGRGKGKPYGPTGFWGRGYVQLTWKDNYAKAGKALGFDLVNNPALAMRPDIAAAIMFRGMSEGWFTGRKLADYFDSATDDPFNARRIVNGTDRAAQIASYYRIFLAALVPMDGAAISPSPAAAPTVAAPSGFWSALRAALAVKLGRKA